MKILVDDMPVFQQECPFYDGYACILDRNKCEYMQLSSHERCTKTECKWLKEEKRYVNDKTRV